MVGSLSPSSSDDSKNPIQTKLKRKPLNLLQKLVVREIRGCFQTHQYGPRLDLFHHLPSRLKFPLQDLVPCSVLNDGHIFLGFTKDGQFVLSYTSQMEMVEFPFAIPSYVYRLYFWRFTPNELLKKVSDIHLFRGYEIVSELFITVCQWPSDNSKILIQGFSPLGDQEHRTPQNPCYLTIAGVPPVYPCEDCAASLNNVAPDDEDEEWDTHQSMCLLHGFVLHVQYHLVPPFPKFNPKVSLKKDGRVVLNTGDSLIALCITAEVIKETDVSNGSVGCTNLDACLSSPGMVSTASGGESTEGETTDVGSQFGEISSVGSKLCSISIEDVMSQASAGGDYLQFSSDSSAALSSDPSSSTSQTVLELFVSPARKRHKFYSKHEIKEEDGCKTHDFTFNQPETLELSDGQDCCNETCTSQMRPCKHSSMNVRGIPESGLRTYSLTQSDESRGLSVQNLKSGYIEAFKENVSPESEAWSQQGRTMAESGAKRHSDFDLAYLSPPLPRSTSPENGSVMTQAAPNYITCASRVFVPHVGPNLSGENEDEEDLGNTAYQNSLSFEVYWPAGTRLVPCATDFAEVTGPALVVKQAAFDVEPYLHETAQRLCNEAGQKYQAFTDYDVQIVDLFVETGDVLALVVMLVQATPKNKSLVKCQRNTSGIIRKQFETGFKFLWNIQTGKYRVVETESLKEIDILKGKALMPRPWNPGRKKCTLLQEKWLLPCAPIQDVLVLSNEPVFTGVSLEEFSPPSGDLAIVKY